MTVEMWQFLVGFLGGPMLAVIALRAFEWRARKQYREDLMKVQSDIAWLSKDLAEAKIDIEWLVSRARAGLGRTGYARARH